MKQYSSESGYEAEQQIFRLIGKFAPDSIFLPHMVAVHKESLSTLVQPLFRQSWADVEVTSALTLKVLQAACFALSLMHTHGFVHGDISPYNILVDDANCQAVVNDYSCSLRKGTELTQYCGTIDYSSDSVDALLQNGAPSTYTYLPLDDHKALFFTVLSRFYRSSSSSLSSAKPRLPWSNEPVKATLLQKKARCIAKYESMIFKQLRKHVKPSYFTFLCGWFKILFRRGANQGVADPACQSIIDYINTFRTVVGEDEVADNGMSIIVLYIYNFLAGCLVTFCPKLSNPLFPKFTFSHEGHRQPVGLLFVSGFPRCLGCANLTTVAYPEFSASFY